MTNSNLKTLVQNKANGVKYKFPSDSNWNSNFGGSTTFATELTASSPSASNFATAAGALQGVDISTMSTRESAAINEVYTITQLAALAAGGISLGAGSVTTVEIADSTIVNADVSSSAAISYSKLNLAGSIVAADLATSSVTTTQISDSTIVNADVSGSAAIDYSKLNLAGLILETDLAAALQTKINTPPLPVGLTVNAHTFYGCTGSTQNYNIVGDASSLSGVMKGLLDCSVFGASGNTKYATSSGGSCSPVSGGQAGVLAICFSTIFTES